MSYPVLKFTLTRFMASSANFLIAQMAKFFPADSSNFQLWACPDAEYCTDGRVVSVSIHLRHSSGSAGPAYSRSRVWGESIQSLSSIGDGKVHLYGLLVSLISLDWPIFHFLSKVLYIKQKLYTNFSNFESFMLTWKWSVLKNVSSLQLYAT